MDFIWVDVGAIKSEPEEIPEKDTQISHCDEIFQPGILKQEIGDTSAIKCEPGTIPEEETQISNCDIILQHGIVKQEAGGTSAIKFEPGTIPIECSSTSQCDPKFQHGVVKQEIEDASMIKCEPAMDEHAKECGAHSEMNIESYDINKECSVHLERIEQSQGKPLTNSSSALSRLKSTELH